ncbi:PaaI family thioesterase [Candidatus Chlorohelix sp.]|uniref:PaaI family thioesterase n=1 Tax=Candidatus Chlorohelix sp. TaxID=3139201 RepID=UPI0030326DD6
MTAIHPYLKNDRYAQYLNIELLEAANGRAKATMLIEPHHLNSHGTAHGGAIFSLADAVLAAASNSHGVVAVAINANISYLKAVTSGTLTAIAEEVSLNASLGVYDIRVTADSGELIATFQGMVYRKKGRTIESGGD